MAHVIISHMVERWLPVLDWEGFYEVSDHGRVQSVDRIITQVIGGIEQPARLRGRILKQSKTPRSGGKVSDPVVTLSAPGRRRHVRVAHLVLEAFVGPRPPGLEACHDPDPDPWNNHRANLRWDTRSANQLDSVRHGTHNQLAQNRRRWDVYYFKDYADHTR